MARSWTWYEMALANVLIWLAAFVLGALVACALVGCGPGACERLGGSVQHRNCHTEWIPQVVSDGNGNVTTWLMPIDECDHVCVMPERPAPEDAAPPPEPYYPSDPPPPVTL